MKYRLLLQVFRHSLLAGMGLVLAACASSPKPYDLSAEAGPVLNRDVSGKSLSVVVRLYQLKASEPFVRTSFEDLAAGKPEAELMGADLVDKTELMVIPGSKVALTPLLQPDTRFVGVVAFFRKPDSQRWRALVKAGDVRSDGLKLKLEDCSFAVLEPKALTIPGEVEQAVSCDVIEQPKAKLLPKQSRRNDNKGVLALSTTQPEPEKKAADPQTALREAGSKLKEAGSGFLDKLKGAATITAESGKGSAMPAFVEGM